MPDVCEFHTMLLAVPSGFTWEEGITSGAVTFWQGAALSNHTAHMQLTSSFVAAGKTVHWNSLQAYAVCNKFKSPRISRVNKVSRPLSSVNSLNSFFFPFPLASFIVLPLALFLTPSVHFSMLLTCEKDSERLHLYWVNWVQTMNFHTLSCYSQILDSDNISMAQYFSNEPILHWKQAFQHRFKANNLLFYLLWYLLIQSFLPHARKHSLTLH